MGRRSLAISSIEAPRVLSCQERDGRWEGGGRGSTEYIVKIKEERNENGKGYREEEDDEQGKVKEK